MRKLFNRPVSYDIEIFARYASYDHKAEREIKIGRAWFSSRLETGFHVGFDLDIDLPKRVLDVILRRNLRG